MAPQMGCRTRGFICQPTRFCSMRQHCVGEPVCDCLHSAGRWGQRRRRRQLAARARRAGLANTCASIAEAHDALSTLQVRPVLELSRLNHSNKKRKPLFNTGNIVSHEPCRRAQNVPRAATIRMLAFASSTS